MTPPDVLHFKQETSPATTSTGFLHQYAHLLPIISSAISGRNCAISLGLLAVLVLLPIPPFLQGVIVCLFSIVALNTLYQTVCSVCVAVVSQNNPLGPERRPFTVPDYNLMSVCEIPAAEEHTSLKCYSGWLNEIHSYDPDNYHLGMMKSVYVKLDGSRLKVSNVANRVPKRSMWNEPVIDKKQLIVTRNRTFNLSGCRVEMLPKGLARKRYFNRKYPMQLIIPCGETGTAVLTPEGLDEKFENDPATQNNGEVTEDKLLFLNDLDSSDFGTTILQADTSTLVKKQTLINVPELSGVDTTLGSDEVRLIFFARCDREKEDWYRRFRNASVGAVRDHENPKANFKYVTEKEAQATRQVTQHLENLNEEEEKNGVVEKDKDEAQDDTEMQFPPESQFDGLLMTPCSARSHPEYVKFMAKYQVSVDLLIYFLGCFVFIFAYFFVVIIYYIEFFRVLVREEVP